MINTYIYIYIAVPLEKKRRIEMNEKSLQRGRSTIESKKREPNLESGISSISIHG